MFARAAYKSKRIRLETGDGLFLYTDGITEAMDGDKNEFTDHRLEALLRKLPGKPLAEIIDGVVSEVTSFASGAPQADDMTTLVLRFGVREVPRRDEMKTAASLA